MNPPVSLICPHDRQVLSPDGRGGFLSSSGRRYPAVEGVPRFVEEEGYASAFGAQWKKFQKTQLDSHTGTTLSRDRLERIAGGRLDLFREKKVLEVGCGAGRFTEVMLDAGAFVFSCDLSTAVEAHFRNFSGHPNHFVCQADLRSLPVREEQFDIVVCVGVIQHTPSPEDTITLLTRQLAPGGLLLIDHYGKNYPDTFSRRWLRSYLLSKTPDFTLPFCERLTRLLWPAHRALYELSKLRGMWRLEALVEKLSPLSDYQYGRPELGKELLFEWAVLDTHDALTDQYKHTRSVEEIEAFLTSLDLEDIECSKGGNGVECRARRPRGEKAELSIVENFESESESEDAAAAGLDADRSDSRQT